MFRSDAIDCNALNFADSGVFVYVLPLLDRSTFKIGFSSNPLQRIYSFHHRYFDYFDLYAALLLRLDSESEARDLEASLKIAHAEFRSAAPTWILETAGGHTEWFCAERFEATRERLVAIAATEQSVKMISAFDHLHNELNQSISLFEFWAVRQAQLLYEDSLSVSLGYERTQSTHALRDWLDAFDYFNIELFVDDPVARMQIVSIARQL